MYFFFDSVVIIWEDGEEITIDHRSIVRGKSGIIIDLHEVHSSLRKRNGFFENNSPLEVSICIDRTFVELVTEYIPIWSDYFDILFNIDSSRNDTVNKNTAILLGNLNIFFFVCFVPRSKDHGFFENRHWGRVGIVGKRRGSFLDGYLN